MSPHPDDLLATVLSLPIERRAQIARELLASLDEETDPGTSREWLQEIQQQAAEVASGTAKTGTWQAIRNRLIGRLRLRRP